MLLLVDAETAAIRMADGDSPRLQVASTSDTAALNFFNKKSGLATALTSKSDTGNTLELFDSRGQIRVGLGVNERLFTALSVFGGNGKLGTRLGTQGNTGVTKLSFHDASGKMASTLP